MKNLDLSLYLVTQRGKLALDDFYSIIDQAVKGGVTAVQLREKDIEQKEFIEIGRTLMSQLKPKGIPLIINDDIEVALEVEADGIHLGQSDSSVQEARRILGKKAIIGLSVETLDQGLAAQSLDIDYIAASPVFSTPSKLDTGKPWGIEGLKKLCTISKLPVIAIGQVQMSNVEDILLAGPSGVAVISAIFNALSPYSAAQDLILKIRECKKI